MTTFTVDPATLSELSSTLTAIHSQMQGMHGVATGYEGLLGGDDLDSEVRGFCSTWNYGITQLASHMGASIQHLDTANAAYGACEHAVGTAASSMARS